MEIDAPFEEKVTKIGESIQGFHVKIIDLEACRTLSTPLEEREKTEKTVVTIVERINIMDEECKKLYDKRTQVCNVLLDKEKLKALDQKLHKVQEKAWNIKDTMNTLPTKKNMVSLVEKKQINQEINQIRDE